MLDLYTAHPVKLNYLRPVTNKGPETAISENNRRTPADQLGGFLVCWHCLSKFLWGVATGKPNGLPLPIGRLLQTRSTPALSTAIGKGDVTTSIGGQYA